jgi:hypothetical protein
MSHPKLRFYCRLIVGGDILLISTTVHFDDEMEALSLHAISHGKNFALSGDATVVQGKTWPADLK